MSDRDRAVDDALQQSFERASLDVRQAPTPSISASIVLEVGDSDDAQRSDSPWAAAIALTVGVAIPLAALLPLGSQKTSVSTGSASPTTSPSATPTHADWTPRTDSRQRV